MAAYPASNNPNSANNVVVSTDALLKALFVDTNYGLHLDEQHTDTATNLEQAKENKPMDLFDKRYLMLIKGDKKPKKRKNLKKKTIRRR